MRIDHVNESLNASLVPFSPLSFDIIPIRRSCSLCFHHFLCLYVIFFDTRYSDYWHSASSGATLVNTLRLFPTQLIWRMPEPLTRTKNTHFFNSQLSVAWQKVNGKTSEAPPEDTFTCSRCLDLSLDSGQGHTRSVRLPHIGGKLFHRGALPQGVETSHISKAANLTWRRRRWHWNELIWSRGAGNKSSETPASVHTGWIHGICPRQTHSNEKLKGHLSTLHPISSAPGERTASSWEHAKRPRGVSSVPSNSEAMKGFLCLQAGQLRRGWCFVFKVYSRSRVDYVGFYKLWHSFGCAFLSESSLRVQSELRSVMPAQF